MTTKLTLTIEKEVIEQAKKYAKSHQRSLSNLIEEYLKSIVGTEDATKEMELPPIVKSLKGSVKVANKDSFDAKQLLEEELIKKYLS